MGRSPRGPSAVGVVGKQEPKKKKVGGAELEKIWSFSSMKSLAAPIGQVLTLALKVKSAVAVVAADFITAG